MDKMCGVCGVYNFNKQAINLKILQSINAKLEKRGPDSGGIFNDKYVGLGNRRLKIIDFEGGNQPFYNEKRDIVLVYNGEIYNYLELKQELEVLGHQFKSKSDTEVLLKMYEAFGEKMLEKINGMFALAFYDRHSSKLLCARDRFGIKPLCFTHNQNGLYIASEAKAIFAMGVKAAWDEYAFIHSCNLQYTPTDRSLFKGVSQLKPGHMMVYDNEALNITKYWDINFPTEPVTPQRSDEEYIAAFREEFEQSIDIPTTIIPKISNSHIDTLNFKPKLVDRKKITEKLIQAINEINSLSN